MARFLRGGIVTCVPCLTNGTPCEMAVPELTGRPRPLGTSHDKTATGTGWLSEIPARVHVYARPRLLTTSGAAIHEG
jgi:hypothetical protein